MKYKVSAILHGSVEVEANSEAEAEEKSTEIPFEEFEFDWNLTTEQLER